MPAANNQLSFPDPVLLSDDELRTETIYVRTSSTIIHPPDATTQDQMNIVEASGSLEFWNDSSEDVYGENDGDAV